VVESACVVHVTQSHGTPGPFTCAGACALFWYVSLESRRLLGGERARPATTIHKHCTHTPHTQRQQQQQQHTSKPVSTAFPPSPPAPLKTWGRGAHSGPQKALTLHTPTYTEQEQQQQQQQEQQQHLHTQTITHMSPLLSPPLHTHTQFVAFIMESFGGNTLAGAEFLREAVRRMDVNGSSSSSSSVRRMKKVTSNMRASMKEEEEERVVEAEEEEEEEEEQGQTEEEVEEEEEGEGGREGRGRKTSLPSMTAEDMDRSSTNPPRAGEEEEEEDAKEGGVVVKGGVELDLLSLSVDGDKAEKARIAAAASAAAAVVAAAAAAAAGAREEGGEEEEEGGHRGYLRQGYGSGSQFDQQYQQQQQQQFYDDDERNRGYQGMEGGREGGRGSGYTLSSHAPPFNSRYHTNHTNGNSSSSSSRFDLSKKPSSSSSSRPSLPPPLSTKPVAQTAEEDVETSFFLNDALDHLPMTLVMLIPDTPAVLADIIGKGGSTVGEIQRLSGCQISIERTVYRGRERKVALMGPICSVSTAQQIIMGRVRHLEEQSGVGREYSHGGRGGGGREGGLGGLGSLSSSSSSSTTSSSSSSSSSTSNSPSFGPQPQQYQQQQQQQQQQHHHHPTWKDAQGCLKLKLCVPNCTVRHLIGRAGTVVSAIERESGCILKFQAEGEMEGGALGRMLEMLGGGYVAHAKACYHVCRKLADDRTLPSTWRGGDVFVAKQKLSKMTAGGVVGPTLIPPSGGGGGGERGRGEVSTSPSSSLSGLATAFSARGLLGGGGGMEGGGLGGLGSSSSSYLMAKSLSLSSTTSNGSAASTSSSSSSSSSSPVAVTAAGAAGGGREGGSNNTGMLAGAPSSHRHTHHQQQQQYQQQQQQYQQQQHSSHEDLLSTSSLFPPSQTGAGGFFSASNLFLGGGGGGGGGGGEGGWGAGDVMMIMEREKERERENREREGLRDGGSNAFGGSAAAAAAAAGVDGGKGVFTVVHVYVPNKAVSFLIGKGGINVTAIEKQSGARLEFTREASPPAAERLVNIKGNAAAVEIAEGLLEAKTLEWQTSPTLIR